VLRKEFGPKGDEVKGEWRKLHNVELNNLYSSPNIIRVIKSRRRRWAEHVARMGEGRCAYRGLVRKPEGMRPLGSLGLGWVSESGFGQGLKTFFAQWGKDGQVKILYNKSE